MPTPEDLPDGGAFVRELRRSLDETRPMAAMQTPSVGRIVHYVYGECHYAAIVTDPAFAVDDPMIGPHVAQALTVFAPNEAPITIVATFDAGATPGTWHWPEPVPPR